MSERYRLHAYANRGGQVRYSNHIGLVTYQQIWDERPDKFQLAVAGTHDGKILVWDLYMSVSEAFVSPSLTPPEPLEVYTDVDAAIMSVAMLDYKK